MVSLLCCSDGVWRVVNRITSEVAELRSDTDWALDFSPEGDAFLSASDGASKRVADGIFQAVVLEQGTDDLRRYLIRAEEGRPTIELAVWFDEHVICKCPLEFPTGGAYNLVFAYFLHQHEIRFSLSSLHDMGKFNMFNGVYNQWCQHGIPRWEGLFSRLHMGGGHILRSSLWDSTGQRSTCAAAAAAAAARQAAQSPPRGPGRVLDFVSISPAGALLVLARTSSSKTRFGGCGLAVDRQKASMVLGALLRRTLAPSGGDLELSICLVDFEYLGPLSPDLCGRLRLGLSFRAGCLHRVDLERFLDQVEAALDGSEAEDMSVGNIDISAQQPLPMADFFVQLASNGKASEGLMSQLCMAAGWALQAALEAEVRTGQASERAPVGRGGAINTASEALPLTAMSDRSKSKFFTRYMASAAKHSKDPILSIALDIGTVSRCPQVVSYLVTADNKAIVAPPQAVLVQGTRVQAPLDTSDRRRDKAKLGTALRPHSGSCWGHVFGYGYVFLCKARKTAYQFNFGVNTSSPKCSPNCPLGWPKTCPTGPDQAEGWECR